MARKVFFSFHYKNDVWRANVVRNSWVAQGREAAGFIDSAEFEKLKAKGDDAVKRWIDGQLKNTSVTVVLIGSETSKRKYVRYEVVKSYEKGNGLVGVYIHKVEDRDGNASAKGDATFGELGKDSDGNSIYFFQVAKTYDYIDDDGYKNMGKWIEEAAK